MPLVLNARTWVLAERLYIHAHGSAAFGELLENCDIDYKEFDYESEFATTKGKYTFMSEGNLTFAHFMQLVPSYKYLPLLEQIIFDNGVKKTQKDNWNYYGERIKTWYPELLDLLQLAGVDTNKATKRLVYTPLEESAPAAEDKDFVSQPYGDVFLDYIRRELNEAYAEGIYLAAMFLARKALEVTLVRVMEVVFPKLVNKEYCETNHSLWYDKTKAKYQSFETLLDNLKEKADSFHEDKVLVRELVALVKPLKNETNLCVHLDYKVPDETYVKQWRIPYVLGLAAKLFRKYCNP